MKEDHLIMPLRVSSAKLPYRIPIAVLFLAGLDGCSAPVLHPQGPVGRQELHLILIAAGLMLIVVVPVFVMAIFFVWRYRRTNRKSPYWSDWSYNGWLDAIVWIVPSIIIAVMGWFSWNAAHRLDPYSPLAAKGQPLTVEVVSLDWKWLFIYPDSHIAAVNKLAIPAGRPVRFLITSDTVMNSFFIPALGSQIYSMANMQTKLHLIADRTGTFRGLSANFSGKGFARMNFTVQAMKPDGFKQWVTATKAGGRTLDWQAFHALAHPSSNVKPHTYARVGNDIFHNILTQYRGGE